MQRWHTKICCKNLTFHSFHSEKGEEKRVGGCLTDLTNQRQAGLIVPLILIMERTGKKKKGFSPWQTYFMNRRAKMYVHNVVSKFLSVFFASSQEVNQRGARLLRTSLNRIWYIRVRRMRKDTFCLHCTVKYLLHTECAERNIYALPCLVLETNKGLRYSNGILSFIFQAEEF